MPRLIVFVVFVLILAWVLTFSDFKELKPDNTAFDITKVEKEYMEKQAAIAASRVVKKAEKQEAEEEVVEFKLVLDTPELKNGHEVYMKAGKCIICHGKMGKGKKSQNAPKVAGQHLWYLVKQLNDMKAGIRVNENMNPYLKNLTQKDLADVSLYLSKLPW